ncbi:MAG: endonuclease [Bacteroidales bacterium]
MKKSLLSFSVFFLLWYLAGPCYGQIPDNYYQAAVGKKKEALKTALSSIINNAGNVSYDGLYTVYRSSDIRSDGKVWDMYSNITNYSFGQNCGSYKVEGDCFNREHSVPQSWFSKASPMVSDAWHVVPTDGKVNGIRSNYPLGEVGSIKTASANNFSKLGNSISPGYSSTVFEPNDLYKGDFARMYFYMATRYQNKVGSWTGGVFSSTYPHLQQWTLNVMLKWHRQDPVSQKEVDRNNAIYKSGQRNRNPFIDYPDLVELIFGNRQSEAFDPDNLNPGEPEPDVPEFEILAPTNITEKTFTINWVAQKDAQDYDLKVFTLENNLGENELTNLFDVTFSSATLPTGWNKDGYTGYDAGKGFRLASKSDKGTIMLPPVQSGEYQLIIKWKDYSSDKSDLLIYADTELIRTIKYIDSNTRIDTVSLSLVQTSVVKIEASKTKRVYLNQVILNSGSSPKEVVLPDYPRRTGNVTTFTVEGLKELTDYYYQLTPVVNGELISPSAVMKVTTTISSNIGNTYEEDQIISYVDNNRLYLLNAPHHASINIIDMSGKKVASYRAIQEEETFALPAKGIYLLEITHPSTHIIRKIYNY